MGRWRITHGKRVGGICGQRSSGCAAGRRSSTRKFLPFWRTGAFRRKPSLNGFSCLRASRVNGTGPASVSPPYISSKNRWRFCSTSDFRICCAVLTSCTSRRHLGTELSEVARSFRRRGRRGNDRSSSQPYRNPLRSLGQRTEDARRRRKAGGLLRGAEIRGSSVFPAGRECAWSGASVLDPAIQPTRKRKPPGTASFLVVRVFLSRRPAVLR